MGCSSGSLVRAGQYEASGPVLAYLMAGPAPVIVAHMSYHGCGHVARPVDGSRAGSQALCDACNAVVICVFAQCNSADFEAVGKQAAP